MQNTTNMFFHYVIQYTMLADMARNDIISLKDYINELHSSMINSRVDKYINDLQFWHYNALLLTIIIFPLNIYIFLLKVSLWIQIHQD